MLREISAEVQPHFKDTVNWNMPGPRHLPAPDRDIRIASEWELPEITTNTTQYFDKTSKQTVVLKSKCADPWGGAWALSQGSGGPGTSAGSYQSLRPELET